MKTVCTPAAEYARLCDVEAAISYARASQDRTGEELSVTRQHEDQRTLATQRGLTIIEEITDNDVSAAGRTRRPGFEAVLTAVRDGRAAAIISTDMSRLTRGKAQDEVRLLELGEQVGLKLLFVRAPDLDLSSAAGRLTSSILIAAARHEIEQKSERQKRAVVQAARQGKRVGGRRPFGFDADGMTMRPREVAALRKAYDDVLHGVSLGRIAREWNDAGLRTPQTTRGGQPSRWSSQNIGGTLLNPRYAGLRHHVDEAKFKRINPVRARLASIVGPAQWEAIVPEEVWRAVVAVLTDPARAKTGRSVKRMLTGVAHCGVCDAGVKDLSACRCQRVHAGANPQKQPTYRCKAAMGHIGRRSEPVDDYVGERVIERLSRDDARDLLVAAEDRPDLPALRSEIAALRRRRRSLARLVADGTLTESEVRQEAADLSGKIAATEAALADTGRASILGPLIDAADVGAAWEALDLERRRAVVAELMEVVLLPPGRGTRTFRPETVVIVPKGSPERVSR